MDNLFTCVKAYLVAIAKAKEEESTGCVCPFSNTNLTPITGDPVKGPFLQASWNAFSIAGIYSLGTLSPPVTSAK